MMFPYIMGFLLALSISLVATPLVRQLAIRINAVDRPNSRKVHSKPVARIGGLAIMLGFLVPVLLNFSLDRRLLGLLGGLLIVFIVGFWDDLKRLKARTKLLWQVIAAGVVLVGGIGIVALTDPFTGGIFKLDDWRIPLEVYGFTFNIIPLANLISILWIVGLINTVNFLDGLDGLATGVSAIAALALFLLALSFGDSGVALLAIILVGALLGFLPYNFNPASIFMGDGGAYSIGLLLAVLSIYTGSKIAIGTLVLGVAIVDTVWAVVRRLFQGKSPFSPDRGHLHHQLLDSGLTQKQVVLFLYLAAVLIALAVLTTGAVTGFLVLAILLVITVSIVRIRAANQLEA